MLLDDKSVRRPAFIFGWAALLLIAVMLDGPIARAILPYQPTIKRSALADEFREAGHFVATLVIGVLLAVLHRDRWRAATLVVLSAALTGVTRDVIAFIVGRTRPIVSITPFSFHPLNFTRDGLLHAKSLSFPSGHACVAFATALSLSYVLPRGRWLFIAIAIPVGLERVAELAHYLSDVTAGALLAVLMLPIAMRLHRLFWARVDQHADPLLYAR